MFVDANNELLSNKPVGNCLEIESIVESLGAVYILNKWSDDVSLIKRQASKRKKWI